jgi:uncharacterized membrane protein
MTISDMIEQAQRYRVSSSTRLLLIQALALMTVGGLTLLDTHIFWNPIPYHSGDVWEYYQAATGVLHGRLPYRDFALEYPPLAVLPFLVPLLLAGGHTVSFKVYCWLLLAANLILSLVFMRTLLSVIRRMTPRPADALTWGVMGVVILSPLLPWRYDLFPALLTLLALRSVQRQHPVAAGVWLGLGVAAKLYPVVFLPILFTYYWLQKDRRAGGVLVAGCVSAIVVSILPFAAAGPKILSFLQYHQHRGIEAGSVAAGVVFLAHLLWRMPVLVVFNYGAFHLVSPLSPVLLKIIPWTAAVLLGLTMIWAWQQFKAEISRHGSVRFETLVVSLASILLAFVVTNKVFSPQYMIWFLPLAPLMARRHIPAFGAVFVLTGMLFPFAFPALISGEHWAIGLLLLRNLFTIGLLGHLLLSTHQVLPSSASRDLPIIQGRKALGEQP